ncbi:MAG: hypothetical protein O3B09_00345 [Proteobacteria bacterium]|nr:hypothetical protein [Pseudomonadota bacterium]
MNAINYVQPRLARDFGEIINLQNNPVSSIKFANSCYQRIKDSLVKDISKSSLDHNLEFIDGQKITNNPNAKYNYIIHPIDGLENLSRALPNFGVVVALEHINGDKKEVIATTIFNLNNNETFFCEKGNGAFLNNRRIRVSQRSANNGILSSVSNKKIFTHPLVSNSNFNFQLTNSLSIDIANLASGRSDLHIAGKKEDRLLDALTLIVKEAGGTVSEKEGLIILSNSKVTI